MISLIERNDLPTTYVVLNGFHISDAKLAVLAMALVNNTHLKTLHLDGNTVSDRGASLLAYALQQNETLEFLSLNDNIIQSAGTDAIAVALHENKTLVTLRLANNSIGDHGAKSLRKMLRHNESIRELVLDGNNISQKMAGKFDDRCRIQHTMEPTDIFGASFYMDNDDARKYIIGCRDPKEDLDASSSWKNLASYMMTLQKTINQREKEEEYHGNEKMLSKDDDDDLSLASEHNEEVPLTERKQKKKWSVFKKTRPDKKIHAQKEPHPLHR